MFLFFNLPLTFCGSDKIDQYDFV